MTLSMAAKFASQNLKANRSVEIPFVLSSSLMLGLFYIMTSLLSNDYVQTRHTSLPLVIGFGSVLTGIFTIVFVIYAMNFLMKRRNKEFALYGILGLEKKHIRKIISIEFLVLYTVIMFLSIVGGYIFGQFSFLGLNYLMRDVSGRLMDYPFSKTAFFLTIFLGIGLYLYTVIRSSFRIYLTTPISLLSQQYSGEGEQKSRYLLMALGSISSAAGYYIAMSTEGIISSLLNFFAATLLVIVGTYILYATFSVIYLKFRKNRISYYQPAHFLRISGLLYRLKSNTMSLASISILSSGVILALSATTAIYSNIQTMAENILPCQYQLENPISLDNSNYQDISEQTLKFVYDSVERPSQIERVFTSYTMTTTVVRKGNEFIRYESDSQESPNYVMFYDLDSYNARTNKNITLKDDEVLMCANIKNMVNTDTIQIGDRKFSVTEIDNIIPSNYAIEVYCIITNNFETMRDISYILPSLNFETQEMEPSQIICTADWDVQDIDTDLYNEKLEDSTFYISKQSAYLEGVYELNGGFLFLGIVIGIIFLTGTILITYFK